MGVFSGGGANTLEQFVMMLADILSFIGFILLILFSLMLIYRNTR